MHFVLSSIVVACSCHAWKAEKEVSGTHCLLRLSGRDTGMHAAIVLILAPCEKLRMYALYAAGAPQEHLKPMLPAGNPSPNSTGRTTSTLAPTTTSSQRSIGIPGASFGRTTSFAPPPPEARSSSEKQEVEDKNSAQLPGAVPSPFADYTAFPDRSAHGAGGTIAENEPQAGQPIIDGDPRAPPVKMPLLAIKGTSALPLPFWLSWLFWALPKVFEVCH